MRHTARVTPDGTHLAFDSRVSLTGYDNTIKAGDEMPITVNPEPPMKKVTSACSEIYIYDATTKHHETARRVLPTGEQPPRKGRSSETVASCMPHNFSEDGSRFFFETPEALVPGDTNAHQDVYEYENGRPYLISGGTDSSDSYFLDASPDGNDVFFLTRQQLVPADQDELFDVL